MNSQKKDEASDRRREEALARRLGEALDRLALRDAGECPDAELIAAYQGKALDPVEISQCESHFAVCARCRKILAVLAASTDAPLAEKEVAHLGELLAAARSPRNPASQNGKPIHPAKLPWKTHWLAPALGIAAVLAMWFAIRQQWRARDQNVSGTLIAQAPKTEPSQSAAIPPLQEFSKVAPEKKSEIDSVTRKDQSAAKAPIPNPGPAASSKNDLEAESPLGSLTSGAENGKNTVRSDEAKQQPEPGSAPISASPLSPAPASPQTPDRVEAQAHSATEAPRTTTQSTVIAGAASATETTADAVANAPTPARKALVRPEEADKKAAGKVRAESPVNGRDFATLSMPDIAKRETAQIRTPSGANDWRVGKGGRIEHSIDMGRTWVLQTSPLQEEWIAGAAVSDTICWIVGRNGAIARTTDGEHWERIPPPMTAADLSGKLPDWSAVIARDAQAATITASDKRRYATQDGGKTWQAQ